MPEEERYPRIREWLARHQIELTDDQIATLAAEIVRRSGIPDDSPDRDAAEVYVLLRLFPESIGIGGTLVGDLPFLTEAQRAKVEFLPAALSAVDAAQIALTPSGGVAPAIGDLVNSPAFQALTGIEDSIRRAEQLAIKFPDQPLESQRLTEAIKEGIDKGDIPASLVGPAADRPEGSADYLQQLADVWLPQFEDRVLADASIQPRSQFDQVFRTEELDRPSEARTVESFDDFRLDALRPVASERRAQQLAAEGKTSDAYNQILADIGADPRTVDKATFDADVDAAEFAGRQALAAGEDEFGVARAVTVALIGTAISFQGRSGEAKQAEELQKAWKGFPRTLAEWRTQLKARLGTDVDSTVVDALAGVLQEQYANLGPQTGLPPPTLDAAISPFLSLVPELSQFVAKGEAAQQVTEERQAQVQDRAGARAEAKRFLDNLDVEATPDLLEFVTAELFAFGQDFDPAEFGAEGFPTTERILQLRGIGADLLRRLGGAEGFRAQEEARRLEEEAETETAAARLQRESSAFKVERLLIEQGFITPGSDPDFLQQISSRFTGPTALSLDIALRQNPDMTEDDIRSFIQQRIAAAPTTDIREQDFRRQGLGALGALGPGAAGQPVSTQLTGRFGPLIRQAAGGDVGLLQFLIRKMAGLEQGFARAQRPTLDEDVFKATFQNIVGVSGFRPGAQPSGGLGGLRELAREEIRGLQPGDPRIEQLLSTATITGQQAQQQAFALATRTPPTEQEFFAERVGGLREEFAGTPRGIAGLQAMRDRSLRRRGRTRFVGPRR